MKTMVKINLPLPEKQQCSQLLYKLCTMFWKGENVYFLFRKKVKTLASIFMHYHFPSTHYPLSHSNNQEHIRHLKIFLSISLLQADGLTAIEAWLIACIVFVFAALVEYTGILLKMKMRKLTGTKRKKDNYAITDLAFFVFFPILFTIFNVLYWTSICWKRLEEQEKYNL